MHFGAARDHAHRAFRCTPPVRSLPPAVRSHPLVAARRFVASRPLPPAPAPAPAPAPIPVPVAAPLVDPNPELVTKLKEAQAEIERLRMLISSMPDPSTVSTQTSPTELRRRNRALSDDGTATSVSSYVEEGAMSPEGVPLQVVIIIALGVFVTTYLFF